VQAARVVWALDEPDPYQPEVKRICEIKNNLAVFPEPLGMWINNEGVFFRDAPEKPEAESQADKAADIILALLQGEP
jgi:hypothetical protein